MTKENEANVRVMTKEESLIFDGITVEEDGSTLEAERAFQNYSSYENYNCYQTGKKTKSFLRSGLRSGLIVKAVLLTGFLALCIFLLPAALLAVALGIILLVIKLVRD